MMIVGLTGSIGMGKSTTARMFAQAGAAVYDADAAVHLLYQGAAAPAIEAAFPGTVRGGAVDRKALGERVIGKSDEMARLEAIVHPLVRDAENRFLAEARASLARLAVLDIPLLLETGGDRRVQSVIVATADPNIQRDRVMARPGMTDDALAAILARQMPDIDKRRRAHFLVDTGHGLGSARRTVASIMRALAGCP